MAFSDTDKRYMLLAWRILGELTVIIAAPVVVFAFLGKYLDERYGSRPMFLIIGFVTAALLTAVVVNRRAKSLAKLYTSVEFSNRASKNQTTDKPKLE